jgi:signal transduction histidine kinase
MSPREKLPGLDKPPSYGRRLIGPILVGMLLGFFVIQPLNVLVYNLAPQIRVEFHNISFWKRLLDMSTDSVSLFMGLFYALVGGITGLCFGLWLYQKDRLQAEQIESARRLTALDTLQELMVTLAHYIRNANMVIGGFSNKLANHLADSQEKQQAELVRQASQKIDLVINSLENLTEISVTQYITSGTARMIDLKQDLDQKLGAADQASPEKDDQQP